MSFCEENSDVIFVIKVKWQGHSKIKSVKYDRRLAYVITIKVIFFTFSAVELSVIRCIFSILSIFWYILQQMTLPAAILDLTSLSP